MAPWENTSPILSDPAALTWFGWNTERRESFSDQVKWVILWTLTHRIIQIYRHPGSVSLLVHLEGHPAISWVSLSPSLPNRLNHIRPRIINYCLNIMLLGLLSGKESVYNSGTTWDVHSIPGSERCPRRGHSNPLQYSCLENPKDRGAWWATAKRVAKSQTWLKRLSMALYHINIISINCTL